MNQPLFGLVRDLSMVCPGVEYSSMYEGYFADVYSRTMEFQSHDVDWYRSKAGSVGSLLDLCGGSGRLARGILEGRRRGVVVDNADAMLAHGATSADPGIEFVNRDAFSLDLEESFDVVVCGGLTFSMFAEGDRRRLLSAAVRHLSAGGTVLFDCLPCVEGETEAVHYGAGPVLIGDSGFSISGVRRSPERGVQTTNMFVESTEPDGSMIRRVTGHELLLVSDEELEADLASAGLRRADHHDFAPGLGSGAPGWPVRFVAAELQ